jgi:hypothetical protein
MSTTEQVMHGKIQQLTKEIGMLSEDKQQICEEKQLLIHTYQTELATMREDIKQRAEDEDEKIHKVLSETMENTRKYLGLEEKLNGTQRELDQREKKVFELEQDK